MISKEENDARMELYLKGLNDQEIAVRLYVDRNTIGQWRRARHLKANYQKSKINWEVVDEMIYDYISPSEIAKEVGCNVNSVRERRRKLIWGK